MFADNTTIVEFRKFTCIFRTSFFVASWIMQTLLDCKEANAPQRRSALITESSKAGQDFQAWYP